MSDELNTALDADVEETETENDEKTSGKLFTQDEVSEIIRKRLSRVRKEAKLESKNDEQSNKIADLENREKAVLLKETLLDRGLPKELSGIVNFSDETDLKGKLDILESMIKQKDTQKPGGFVQIGSSGQSANFESYSDPIKTAMNLK